MRSRISGIVMLVTILLGARGLVSAKPIRPDDVPVMRLITNIERYVKEHPKDSKAYTLLGRLHSYAFAYGELEVQVYLNKTPDELPRFYSTSGMLMQAVIKGRKERRDHLLASVKNYEKATKLSSDDAIPVLGLGWMLEQGTLMGEEAGACPVDNEKSDWHTAALKSYRKAYTMQAQKDSAERSLWGGFSIAKEAAEGILRLWKEKKLNDAEMKQKKEYEAFVAAIKKKPMMISPIIFPLKGYASLTSLLDNKKRVRFDIAGDGVPRKWHWVTAQTGILVWDPKHQGKIRSGSQLFGTRSWNMFWKDGYRALDALDDNHDGFLSGKELEGISVWIDKNGNGRSDPGEVAPVQKLGITQIASRSQGRREGVLWNRNGIRFSDGRDLPTYDWTPRSL